MNLSVSPLKQKGLFKWKTIYYKTLRLNNCELQDIFVNDANRFESTIKLNSSSIDQLAQFEIELKKQLTKDNCYLKSQINTEIIKLRLWLVAKQIKTEIRNMTGDLINYSNLKKGDLIDIDIKIDSIWAHNNYYPNFIYKIKPLFIQVCE